ncbi:MAG: Gfo/Idh/MocA family oxidoreductase [Saprospiraceae bacterium]|nr:Gfo/Idh/MocA family oxidoreductase [Saprospiraceae bacterium]MBK6566607.1 Gfo/Idh/MocA family oxidoreductase [Saprospiraceae bacterium]MBK8081073.1 Gfo/Idh/MocA family oxidoreductase [Saprospiraceae bacterium]MBK8549332.1 Gfo/Idh/MocA family oxidoreductase [Saprospiraceae bacterium]MBK8819711.1 Gfo/Idh/MocA family oxidoreductase [Saprospiraceae bacterium]
MKRRNFIKDSAITASTFSVFPNILSSVSDMSSVRLGFIGVGARGMETLELALRRKDIVVTAICDIDTIHAEKAKKLVEENQGNRPVLFTSGPYDFENMLSAGTVDAVIISTPWEWHTIMSVAALKQKIAVGCEVAGAASIEECWQVVRAVEDYHTPFMILENVCYRRDVMAVLNMARKNMFGELIHLEGGYQHDLREVKFNNGQQLYGGGVEFGDNGYSEAKWRTLHSVHRNGDLYPTHGIGPISNLLHINRGNRFTTLSSMASKSRGLHNHIVQHSQGGLDHPNSKIKFKLGDVVVSFIQTQNEETIVLTHDTNLPRPYSLGFRVQGTKGIWMDINKSIYLEGMSPSHKWETAETYLKEFEHPLWKKYESDASGSGHGGMDFFVLNAFIEALKNKEPMPLDVYDHATWAAITCLSEQSIQQGGMPQEFPDFTNGKWMKRKPVFALDDRY